MGYFLHLITPRYGTDKTAANSSSDKEERSPTGPRLPAIKITLYDLLDQFKDIRYLARHSHCLAQILLLVQRRFPCARESLCRQIAESIYARGISLQYMQVYNKKLICRLNDKNGLENIKKRREKEIAAPTVSSVNKDMAPQKGSSLVKFVPSP